MTLRVPQDVAASGSRLIAGLATAGLLGLFLAAASDLVQGRAQAAAGVKLKAAAGARTGTVPGEEAGSAQRVGRAIKITLPITGETVSQVRRFVSRVLEKTRGEKQHPLLILQFEVPPRQGEFGRGSKFGSAYDLADFLSSEELNAVTTVAYIPKSIQGHAVLAALACDEIIMAPDAEIGAAGVDESSINETWLEAYKEIADRRKTVPAEIALRMLDPSREVLEVETEVSRQFVSRSELEELRKRQTIQFTRVLIPVGQPGIFSGSEARRLGFVSYLASNRRDVAKALELPPEAVEEDPSLGDKWKPVLVRLKGPVRADVVDQMQTMISNQIRVHEVNFICVWIDSPGGSVVDSMRLANFLAFQLDPGKVRTVAYIPREARSDAALVAMACDQVVTDPRAVLGGPGARQFGTEDIRVTRQTIRESLAPKKSRSWSLPVAIIDPTLVVFRCTREGDTEYFCEEELAEQPAREKWQKNDPVTVREVPFQADGQRAVQYRLASRTVEDFAQFKQHYGLLDDPALLEPGWADYLIEALASPGIAALLLAIGFGAMYVELQSPGIGIGGFIAAVCFLLFFWSRYLGGTAGWLEVVLFLTGMGCLALEVFVIPGFGIFGLGGGFLVLASLVLASQTFVLPRNAYQFAQLERSLWMVAGAAVGVIAAVVLLRRWFSRTPMLSKMVLEPPSDDQRVLLSQRESLADRDRLLGQRGITTTQLIPGGKARFGNKLLDVIAQGEEIQRGTEVVVVEVRGNRIVVQAVDR